MDASEGFSRRLIASLALSSMLTPLNSTMLSVMLGPIGAEFGESETMLTQSLVTSYLITSIVMQAPSGKIGDRIGHRRAVGIGQFLFGLGSLAAIAAPTTLTLALARIIMASGGALIVPSAGALLRLEIPAEKRGQAFGAFGASMALSAAIGPVLGGLIAGTFSWRANFAVSLVVLPLAALLAGKSPRPTTPSNTPIRFDIVGSLLLGLGLTAAVIAANAGHGTRRTLLFALTLGLIVIFVAWEKRQREPVVDLGLLGRPVFLAGGLVVAMHNLAMYALLFELPSAIARVSPGDPHSKGLLLGSMMLAMVVISPISGRLADKLGARNLAFTGTALALGGMSWVYLRGLSSTIGLVPGLVMFGMGLGLAASPSQASAMSAAPREESGMAAALLAMLRYLGGVAGIVVLSFVWSAPADPRQVVLEHGHALSVFAVALCCAVVASAFLPKEAPGRLD